MGRGGGSGSLFVPVRDRAVFCPLMVPLSVFSYLPVVRPLNGAHSPLSHSVGFSEEPVIMRSKLFLSLVVRLTRTRESHDLPSLRCRVLSSSLFLGLVLVGLLCNHG